MKTETTQYSDMAAAEVIEAQNREIEKLRKDKALALEKRFEAEGAEADAEESWEDQRTGRWKAETERDEWKAKVEQAGVEVAGLREQVDGLLQEIHNLTDLADESFDSWHRIEFGSQGRVNPDVRAAYIAGHRNAYSKKTLT